MLLICDINIHISKVAIEFNFCNLTLIFIFASIVIFADLDVTVGGVVSTTHRRNENESKEEKGVKIDGEKIETLPVHLWIFQCK